MEFILAFIGIWILSVLIQEFTGNFWRSTQLTEDKILVILYGSWKYKQIPYSEITEIRKATFMEGLWGWFTLSRDRLLKTPVTIVWRHAGLNKYIISPDNAEKFIEEVKARIEKSLN